MKLKPGYKLTEVGVIPEEWEVKSLKELAIIATGSTPPTNDPSNYGDEFLFVSPIDLGEIKYITNTAKMLSKKGFSISRPFPPNSILFVCIGSTIGKCGIASIELTSNQQINTIFPSTTFSSDYLYYAVSDRASAIRVLAGEQAVPLVNKTQFSETLIKIPPLPEQHAIAEALSDMDALLAALDQLIAKKRDLKQATMQQLLTGAIRLPGFRGEWEVRRLGEILDTDPENLEASTPPNFTFNYIALEDVDRGVLRSYSEQIFAQAPSRARRKLRRNDVLISTVRPNLQSHLVFQKIEENWVCSTGFCVARCREGITDPKYIFFHFFASCVNSQIDALLTGSNYPAINSGDIRAIEIPLPPLPEQTAIAEILSEMDAEILALEERRKKTAGIKQGMMQELLTGRVRLV